MLRTKQPSTFSKIKGHKHNIFSLRIGQDKMGKSVLTSPQHQYRLLHHNHCQWRDLNSQPLHYKPSALNIELTSSKAIAGKELSLSSRCIASLYIYHCSTVVDVSSEKYSGSTGHKNSWYQQRNFQ